MRTFASAFEELVTMKGAVASRVAPKNNNEFETQVQRELSSVRRTGTNVTPRMPRGGEADDAAAGECVAR